MLFIEIWTVCGFLFENDKTVIDIIWKIRYTKRNGKGV